MSDVWKNHEWLVFGQDYRHPGMNLADIAFSRQFYCALAGSLPIERAVSAGRVAAYNVKPKGRDWGVPVLYLRAQDGQLFEGATNEKVPAEARQSAEADVKVQVKEVAAGGLVLGAKVREMLGGKLGVEVTVGGRVFGKVIGFEADSFGAAPRT